MAQRQRDRAADAAKYPDERWSAECPRTDAPLLLRHDHHTVWIGGRRALLLTYRWMDGAIDDGSALLPFEVSFTYARGHPSAPAEVQAVVERLDFLRVA